MPGSKPVIKRTSRTENSKEPPKGGPDREEAMLVSCDDFGMLFFQSVIQYSQFYRHLPPGERSKYHRHSQHRTRLRAIRTASQTVCPILLRI
jgi:hypothetical protein